MNFRSRTSRSPTASLSRQTRPFPVARPCRSPSGNRSGATSVRGGRRRTRSLAQDSPSGWRSWGMRSSSRSTSTQGQLFPAHLSEALDPRDPVFFISDLVEGLDLEGFEQRYAALGEHAYPPRMLLKLWLFGAVA